MTAPSHQHEDHVGALAAILNDLGDVNTSPPSAREPITIGNIYGSMLSESDEHIIDEDITTDEERTTIGDLNDAIANSGLSVHELALGYDGTLDTDEVKIEVLGIKNTEFDVNYINNSSVVLRMWDTRKSVLFLGDLGEDGGDKLMNSPYRSYLKSDYVQMAHHGQRGVDQDFYHAVSPTYCLWPTPLWEYNNTTDYLVQTVLGWMQGYCVAHYWAYDYSDTDEEYVRWKMIR